MQRKGSRPVAACLKDSYRLWILCMQEEWHWLGLALATIVAAIVLVAVSHGPILVALPITMAFGFAAGLLSAPLISAPVVSAPIVSTPIISAIVPTTVMPVSVVMGQQRSCLLVGHAGQARPRVVGSLDRCLNGCDFRCDNRGCGLHLCC